MAEIQSTISVRELDLWGRYRRKYGPMSPVRKYDAGPALVASLINQTNGGKAMPKDFMPYGREVDNDGDQVIDADSFVALLKTNPRTRIKR